MDQMMRVTITITEDQLDAIDQLARELRISRSAAIRQAIDIYLAVNGGVVARATSRHGVHHDLEPAHAR